MTAVGATRALLPLRGLDLADPAPYRAFVSDFSATLDEVERAPAPRT